MWHHRLPPSLLPLLILGACTEQEPPTSTAEWGDRAADHAPGHKVVNSLADPGNGICNATQCTLREAINDPQSTEITFAPGLTGAITLAPPGAGGGRLEIEKSLRITGPSTGIIIRRRSTDPAFRILRIGSGVTVRLTRLTIQGGKPAGPGGVGGGIVNFGTLALASCTVVGNSAAFGGGISNHQGKVTLTNSRVAQNSGGGLFSQEGTLTLTNSTVAQNSGRGLLSQQGTLTLTNSTVAHNSSVGISNRGGTLALTNSTVASNSGGGIGVGQGTATLIRARIVDNSVGGGIVNSGSVTITNSTVARNSSVGGGGIRNIAGTVTLTNSTVAGNSAEFNGGGIFNDDEVRSTGTVTLTNSTISGNSARFGGGIHNLAGDDVAFVRLVNSTVARNSASQEGGGILNEAGEAIIVLTNSLVARNSGPMGPDVLDQGTEFSARFSLIGIGDGSGVSDGENGNQVGSSSSPLDPKIGPLADNGGPTRTHALLLGSPAIDAASTPDCPPTDQRGVLRPQGPACDIGSYERRRSQ